MVDAARDKNTVGPWDARDSLIASTTPDPFWHNAETDLLERGIRALHFEVEETEGWGGPFDGDLLNWAWWWKAQDYSGRWAS